MKGSMAARLGFVVDDKYRPGQLVVGKLNYNVIKKVVVH